MFTIMNRGGAETMVMNYYRKIDRTKVQFDFLVHRQERGAYDDEIEALGGRIYRTIPIYPQNFYQYKKFLHAFFEEHKEYKIIHSHMSELGYFAFKEAKKQGIPIRICHAHNAPHGWDMKMFIRTYFKKMMMPYITHMFMCGIESGEWLFGKKNNDKFIQMNNAIDTKKFIYNENIRDNLRKMLNISQNEIVVGHVGRFNYQKNHDFLIDIFDEVHKILKNSKLLLVGAGDLENKIKKRVNHLNITNDVIFLGNRNDVNDLMQAMDIFVFPSHYEGLPVTLVEAQASGLPVIKSNYVPGQCIMTPNVYTLSLNSSSKEWANQIVDIMKEYKRTDSSHYIIENQYDISTNAKWLEEFYLKEVEKYGI